MISGGNGYMYAVSFKSHITMVDLTLGYASTLTQTLKNSKPNS